MTSGGGFYIGQVNDVLYFLLYFMLCHFPKAGESFTSNVSCRYQFMNQLGQFISILK